MVWGVGNILGRLWEWFRREASKRGNQENQEVPFHGNPHKERLKGGGWSVVPSTVKNQVTENEDQEKFPRES